jgi:hypothetical protein
MVGSIEMASCRIQRVWGAGVLVGVGVGLEVGAGVVQAARLSNNPAMKTEKPRRIVCLLKTVH